MPLAAETPLFSPGGRVTLTALKWSGTSVTVGSLVAATTVRVIAGAAGGVCAAPRAGGAPAPGQKNPGGREWLICPPGQPRNHPAPQPPRASLKAGPRAPARFPRPPPP